jgi:hypothetical protein
VFLRNPNKEEDRAQIWAVVPQARNKDLSISGPWDWLYQEIFFNKQATELTNSVCNNEFFIAK